MQECKANGIDVLIYCTYRDEQSQNMAYAQGRTLPGAIVTNRRGGESMHQHRVAFDAVPMLHGKPAWDNTTADGKRLWATFGKCGEAVGLEWSGRWSGKLKESAHFQYTGGLNLAQLKAGMVPK
jgi:peptidoglycan L-alanyl-D-glutamate endopeptidase CwlK